MVSVFFKVVFFKANVFSGRIPYGLYSLRCVFFQDFQYNRPISRAKLQKKYDMCKFLGHFFS